MLNTVIMWPGHYTPIYRFNWNKIKTYVHTQKKLIQHIYIVHNSDIDNNQNEENPNADYLMVWKANAAYT